MDNLRVDVVTGFAASPLKQSLDGGGRVRFWKQVSSEEMAGLMGEADLFIGGAGGSTWERACQGLPSIVVSARSGQDEILRALAAAGIVVCAGDHRGLSEALIESLVGNLMDDPEAVRTMSERAKQMVDGLGSVRVADALVGGEKPHDQVSLVPFEPRHVSRTFTWVTDPALRQEFSLHRHITRASNRAFYRTALGDETQRFYAIMWGSEHIGNAGLRRIDLERLEAEVWIYIGDRANRGKGYGSVGLGRLLAEARQCLGLRALYLHVAETNAAALALYAGLGFAIEKAANDDPEWAGAQHAVFRMKKEIQP